MKKIFSVFFITLSINLLAQAKAEIFLLDESNNHIKIVLMITLKDDWHIYWLNSGDSGIPTNINWKIQDGFTISKTEWPTPDLFYSDGFVSYGYSDTVLFFYKIQKEDNSSSVEFVCEIKSLICKNVCIPFDTVISFSLNNRKIITASDDILLQIRKKNQHYPIKNHNLKISAERNKSGVILTIKKNQPEILSFNQILFISFENGIFQNTENQEITQTENEILLKVKFDNFKIKEPEFINGLLLIYQELDYNHLSKHAYEISVKIN
jgi:thiol:disulfide interchange protein DsbD